jgi:thioredoxin reductase (NADPH)
MAENEVYDLVIVGDGPGGLRAGIYAMRAVLKTVLVKKGLHGGPGRGPHGEDEAGGAKL